MIAPEQDADFVYHMEDVLDTYKLAFNPNRPVVCFDEMNKQLISDIRDPIPAMPGKPAKEDYHYKKNGIVNIFMFAEPLAGNRYVKLFDRKTGLDFAEAMRILVEDFYPNAEKIHKHITAKELNKKSIGHFGFFREKVGSALWPETVEWLKQEVKSAVMLK